MNERPRSGIRGDAGARPRRVTLGVTGSIAAYKAAEIVRLFVKREIDVHCILTAAGAEFITPLTLGTLSGNPVTTGMFGEATGGPYQEWSRAGASAGENTGGIRHIQASRESGLLLVAPATANILGKVAHGIADDSLSTAIMASSVPVLFAPAMNTRMWESAANQANVALLRARGFRFVQPGSGELACGELGTGRMADPEEIVAEALRLLGEFGAGRRVLVTAGRTEEDLDPVRFLSNRSSGRMGFAVAAAARDRGYEVTVIAGATAMEPPLGMTVVRVRSAAEMASAVRRLEGAHEILVMAAAVADYRPRRVSPKKIRRGAGPLDLELVPNEDILASLRGHRAGKVTIGFALETEREIEGAERKLAAKGVDLIVLNNPTRAGSEFGGQTNQVVFLHRDGFREELPRMSKDEVGTEILQRAEDLLDRLEEEKTEAARRPKRAAAAARKPRRDAAPPRRKRGSR